MEGALYSYSYNYNKVIMCIDFDIHVMHHLLSPVQLYDAPPNCLICLAVEVFFCLDKYLDVEV